MSRTKFLTYWPTFLIAYSIIPTLKNLANSSNPDFDIAGLDVTCTPAEPMQGNNFTIAIQTGTGILLFADYGDNETLEMLWISDTNHIPSITVPYAETGQYNATFWARTASSTATASTEAFVDYEITADVNVSRKAVQCR